MKSFNHPEAKFIQMYTNESIYCPTVSKIFEKFNAAHFLKSLVDLNIMIFFIGDSITNQMRSALYCMLENEGLPNDSQRLLELHIVNYLVQLPPQYFVVDPNHDVSIMTTEYWVNRVKSCPFQKKIVIINSGAWFTPHRLRNKEAPNTPLDLKMTEEMFREHFVAGGHLDNTLLPVANVTTPDRTADFNPFAYYNKFSLMNSIARRLFTNRKDRAVLPDIWHASLPQWELHIGGEKKDQLHWCSFVPNSVPWMWNEILYNHLLDNHFYSSISTSTSNN
eukprot:gene4011-7988_t